MQKISTPTTVKYEKGKNENRGNIIIEPFFPGYGITLGNSIRRVMLSSLPGAAAIGIKIKGAEHEFTTIPHLKEDVLEFILKLKQLRLKIFSDETIKLELDVHGKKEITAKDIKANSQVEIINGDLVLGHITDMSGSLYAEIFVAKGMGYEMIEARESQEKEIGYIEMDSVFSPVMAVGLRLENVRVGKMTNWERLVLDITTDGTIMPPEAFEKSVQILLEQFTSLLSEEGKIAVKKVKAEEISEKIDEQPKPAEKEPAETGEKPAEEKHETDPEETENEPVKRKRGRPKKDK